MRPIADPSRSSADPESNYAEVVVGLEEGSELVERVRFARGDPRGGVPLSLAELEEKYRDCARIALPAETLERSLEMFARLDELPDVGLLTRRLVVS